MNQRIKPISNSQDYRKDNYGTGGIAMMLIPVLACVGLGLLGAPGSTIFCVSFTLFLVFGFIVYTMENGLNNQLTKGLDAKEKYTRSQSQTNANILHRYTKEQEYGPGDIHHSYHINLEFKPKLKAGTVQVQAQIKKSLFFYLADKKSVNITYAIEDPCIFLIDGE